MPRTADIAALGSLAVVSAVTAAVYSRLPEQVATHFDIHGDADAYMPKAAASVLLPALGLGVWALVRFAPRVLPRTERERLGPTTIPLVGAMIAAFVAIIHVAVLAVALRPGVSIMKVVWLAMGALFVALGLIMPRLRRNPIVGVRTAWTLTSDETWARTHRVAGYTMVASGLVAALAGAFGGVAGTVVAIVSVLLGSLVPAVYSLVLARRGS